MSITVKLIGGLGNQLFGYFAGKYLAERLGTDLVLDLSQQKHNKHNRSSILDLNIVRGEKLIWSSSRVVAEKVLKLFPKLFLISGQSLGQHLRYFRAEGLGWDPRLDLVESGSTITGHFQTYKYFQHCLDNSPRIELTPKSPSSWYLRMVEMAEQASPITVHMRRGDYQDHSEEIGVYSTKYFLDGIQRISEVTRDFDSEIWVFSDSIEDVSRELRSYRRRIRVISPPENSSAAESMHLFGLGSSQVISNSTFSYWGAITGRGSLVVAPQKWFRGWDDPVDLLPPNWQRIQGEFNN